MRTESERVAANGLLRHGTEQADCPLSARLNADFADVEPEAIIDDVARSASPRRSAQGRTGVASSRANSTRRERRAHCIPSTNLQQVVDSTGLAAGAILATKRKRPQFAHESVYIEAQSDRLLVDMVAGAVLRAQRVDLDSCVATVLRHHVSDPLSLEVERTEALLVRLGAPRTQEVDEAD
jgi:hypothetical protein